MEEKVTTEIAVLPPTPAELEQYKALMQLGPVGVIIVLVLLFSKVKKDFMTDRIALDQSQKLLEQRLAKIESKLDFLLDCLEDDEPKN